jgi:hypothetical protein
MPWDPVPVAETVALIQADVRFMVSHTAVLVRCDRPELRVVVNTPRGQIIPAGVCRFADGTEIEYQDLGMPQPGAEVMTVGELVARTWDVAANLGLSL